MGSVGEGKVELGKGGVLGSGRTGSGKEECGGKVRRTVDALLVWSVVAEALPRSRVQ